MFGARLRRGFKAYPRFPLLVATEHSPGLVQAAGPGRQAQAGHQVTGRRELHDAIVAGVGDPDVAARVKGDSTRTGQHLLAERLPETGRMRQRTGPRTRTGRTRPGQAGPGRRRPKWIITG